MYSKNSYYKSEDRFPKQDWQIRPVSEVPTLRDTRHQVRPERYTPPKTRLRLRLCIEPWYTLTIFKVSIKSTNVF